MKAYGVELPESDHSITYRDRTYQICGCTCMRCDCDFFVPAVPEHEPILCPYCGIRFNGVTPNAEPRQEDGT